MLRKNGTIMAQSVSTHSQSGPSRYHSLSLSRTFPCLSVRFSFALTQTLSCSAEPLSLSETFISIDFPAPAALLDRPDKDREFDLESESKIFGRRNIGRIWEVGLWYTSLIRRKTGLSVFGLIFILYFLLRVVLAASLANILEFIWSSFLFFF